MSMPSYARRTSRQDSVWYMGALFTFLSTSEDTNGAFLLVEAVAQSQASWLCLLCGAQYVLNCLRHAIVFGQLGLQILASLRREAVEAHLAVGF